MCISSRIKKYIEEKEALDARIAKLEKLEMATAPVKNLLTELLGDYAKEAPEDLADVWDEILAIGQKFDLAVQPLASDELKAWEVSNREIQELKQELKKAQREWGELSDERDDLEARLAELRSQLPIIHSNPTADEEKELTGKEYYLAVEEELALDDDETELQKILVGNSNFTFEELGVSVVIQSVIAPADDTVDFASEEASISVTHSTGETREYFLEASTFVYAHKDNIRQAALGYANYLLGELKKEAKIKEKIARWNAEKGETSDPEVESETETRFKAMGYSVQVFPQPPMGATFSFLDAEGTVKFANSLTSPEIGDRPYKVIAEELIANFQNKEATKRERLENPHAKEEDKFIELIKISNCNCVGYLRRRDNGEIIAGYAAFSMRDEQGEKTATFAKPRATKWAEYLRANNEASEEGKNSKMIVSDPRKSQRLVSDNPKQVFVYELKFTGINIGYLELLAQQDFSVPPAEQKVKKPLAAKVEVVAPIYHVITNGYQLASGSEDKMQLRFEQELQTFGSEGKFAMSLTCNGENVEAYDANDFAFVRAQDFDEENPEYFTLYKPTNTNFRVYRSLASGTEWINSIYPYRPNLFATKEAAAVDAVRRQSKAEKAE